MELISAALDNGEIEKLLAMARPEGPNYARLKAALAKYRAFEADGGWPAIEEGPVLKPGDRDLVLIYGLLLAGEGAGG